MTNIEIMKKVLIIKFVALTNTYNCAIYVYVSV